MMHRTVQSDYSRQVSWHSFDVEIVNETRNYGKAGKNKLKELEVK